LITLYHGTGAQDFQILGQSMSDDEQDEILLNARQILRARGEDIALQFLQEIQFNITDGTNFFNDEFSILFSEVPLAQYERLRKIANNQSIKSAFFRIAEVITEIGPYIRFIAVDLERIKKESWDVFICHATEDKQTVAKPIYEYLDSVGIHCWFDEGEILWGDSIVKKINEGLSKSRFVIVVISTSMLHKNWAIKEMRAALAIEVNKDQNRILPLLVGSKEGIKNIKKDLPILMDKKYLIWPVSTQQIERELRLLLQRDKKV